MFYRFREFGFFGLFLFFFIVVFLCRTFSPGRVYVYSAGGGILLIILSLSWFARVLLLKIRLNQRDILVALLFFGLFFLFSISSLFSIDFVGRQAYQGLVNNLLIQVSVVFISLFLVSEKRFDFVKVAVFIASFVALFAVLSALSALQFFLTKKTLWGLFAISVDELRWPQLYGWYASPNYLIDTLALGVLALIFLYSVSPFKKTISLALLFMLACVVLTGSLGGILGLVLALLFSFFAIFVMRKGIERKVALVLKVGFVFGLLVFLVLGFILSYLSVAGLDLDWVYNNVLRIRPERIVTGTGRTEIWSSAFTVYSDQGFFNICFGLGNNQYFEKHGVSMHSAHFQLMIDHGLVAYAFFLLLYLLLFFLAFKVLKGYRGEKNISVSVVYFLSVACYSFFRGFFQSGVFLSGSLPWLITIFAFFAIINLHGSGVKADVS